MKQFCIITVVGLVLLMAGFSPARAQEQIEIKPTDYRHTFLNNPYYNKMARAALRDQPARFDFMNFRSLYARTSQYDPLGEDTLKELNDLAYAILNEKDPERAETLLFGYKILISNHLAHLGVVMQALSLARQDRRFGKVEFFEWMKDGLIKSVLITGDGYTLQGAYDVVTMAEDIILFNRLNFKQLSSKSVKEGYVYYTMHDVEDLNEGTQRTVFVNTTIPMKYLDALKQEQEETFTLDIQKQ